MYKMAAKSGGTGVTLNKIIAILLALIVVHNVALEISDFKACKDPECEEPISEGRAIGNFHPTDTRFLSFNKDDTIIVYSKSAGQRQDLWSGEVQSKPGIRGYFIKNFVHESKLFEPRPKYVMPTEESSFEEEEDSLQDVEALAREIFDRNEAEEAPQAEEHSQGKDAEGKDNQEESNQIESGSDSPKHDNEGDASGNQQYQASEDSQQDGLVEGGDERDQSDEHSHTYQEEQRTGEADGEVPKSALDELTDEQKRQLELLLQGQQPMHDQEVGEEQQLDQQLYDKEQIEQRQKQLEQQYQQLIDNRSIDELTEEQREELEQILQEQAELQEEQNRHQEINVLTEQEKEQEQDSDGKDHRMTNDGDEDDDYGDGGDGGDDDDSHKESDSGYPETDSEQESADNDGDDGDGGGDDDDVHKESDSGYPGTDSEQESADDDGKLSDKMDDDSQLPPGLDTETDQESQQRDVPHTDENLQPHGEEAEKSEELESQKTDNAAELQTGQGSDDGRVDADTEHHDDKTGSQEEPEQEGEPKADDDKSDEEEKDFENDDGQQQGQDELSDTADVDVEPSDDDNKTDEFQENLREPTLEEPVQTDDVEQGEPSQQGHATDGDAKDETQEKQDDATHEETDKREVIEQSNTANEDQPENLNGEQLEEDNPEDFYFEGNDPDNEYKEDDIDDLDKLIVEMEQDEASVRTLKLDSKNLLEEALREGQLGQEDNYNQDANDNDAANVEGENPNEEEEEEEEEEDDGDDEDEGEEEDGDEDDGEGEDEEVEEQATGGENPEGSVDGSQGAHTDEDTGKAEPEIPGREDNSGTKEEGLPITDRNPNAQDLSDTEPGGENRHMGETYDTEHNKDEPAHTNHDRSEVGRTEHETEAETDGRGPDTSEPEVLGNREGQAEIYITDSHKVELDSEAVGQPSLENEGTALNKPSVVDPNQDGVNDNREPDGLIMTPEAEKANMPDGSPPLTGSAEPGFFRHDDLSTEEKISLDIRKKMEDMKAKHEAYIKDESDLSRNAHLSEEEKEKIKAEFRKKMEDKKAKYEEAYMKDESDLSRIAHLSAEEKIKAELRKKMEDMKAKHEEASMKDESDLSRNAHLSEEEKIKAELRKKIEDKKAEREEAYIKDESDLSRNSHLSAEEKIKAELKKKMEDMKAEHEAYIKEQKRQSEQQIHQDDTAAKEKHQDSQHVEHQDQQDDRFSADALTDTGENSEGKDYEVIEGTTLYFNDLEPSMVVDHEATTATPGDIQPTSSSAAQPQRTMAEDLQLTLTPNSAATLTNNHNHRQNVEQAVDVEIHSHLHAHVSHTSEQHSFGLTSVELQPSETIHEARADSQPTDQLDIANSASTWLDVDESQLTPSVSSDSSSVNASRGLGLEGVQSVPISGSIDPTQGGGGGDDTHNVQPGSAEIHTNPAMEEARQPATEQHDKGNTEGLGVRTGDRGDDLSTNQLNERAGNPGDDLNTIQHPDPETVTLSPYYDQQTVTDPPGFNPEVSPPIEPPTTSDKPDVIDNSNNPELERTGQDDGSVDKDVGVIDDHDHLHNMEDPERLLVGGGRRQLNVDWQDDSDSSYDPEDAIRRAEEARNRDYSRARSEGNRQTSGTVHSWWADDMIDSAKPLLEPLLVMMPESMYLALQEDTFYGIPWTAVFVSAAIGCLTFGLLFCKCMCGLCGKKKVDPLVIKRQLEQQMQLLEKEKQETATSLADTQRQVLSLQTSLENHTVDANKLREEKKRLESLYQKICTQSKSLEDELTRYKQQLTHQTELYQEQQNQSSVYQQQLTDTMTQVTILQHQIQEYERSVSESEMAKNQLQEQIITCEDQIRHSDETKQQLGAEVEDLKNKIKDLTEQLDGLADEKQKAEEKLQSRDNELEVLKDCLVQLKSIENLELDEDADEADKVEHKVKQMMDIAKVTARLTVSEEERDRLAANLQTEITSKQQLEDTVAKLTKQIEGLQVSKIEAEKQYKESQTKLTVLTEYFKEKETKMQRQLGVEETLRIQSQEQLETVEKKAAVSEEDTNNYKKQIQDLKKELEKVEQNFRSEVASHEKKAHESWLSSRNSEREKNEAKRENAQLRQKITELEGRLQTAASMPVVKPSSIRPHSPPRQTGERAGLPKRGSPRENQTDGPSPAFMDKRPPSPRDGIPPPMMGRMGPPPPRDMRFPPPDMRSPVPPPDLGPLPPPHMDRRGPPPPRDMLPPRDFNDMGPPPPSHREMGRMSPPHRDYGPMPPRHMGPPPPLPHEQGPFPPGTLVPQTETLDHHLSEGMLDRPLQWAETIHQGDHHLIGVLDHPAEQGCNNHHLHYVVPLP
ncbi:transport and Golgi organization protein 1 homolog [Ptychodera flava]|uniref:transport and Golgi organization protein 1 homolog n=1 Tax=Ptychodera flava TaxID=63121 RepID=UPI00396A6F1B